MAKQEATEESVQAETMELLDLPAETADVVVETPEPVEAAPESVAPVDTPVDTAVQTGELEAGSPPAEETPSDSAEITGLKAEMSRIREKNRELEANAMLAQPQAPPMWAAPQQPQYPGFQQQAQPVAPQPAAPEFFDVYDAEGNPVRIANPDHAVRQAVEPMQAQMDAFRSSQINDSENAARTLYPDFDHALNGFRMALQINPSLEGQMRSNENPAEFAYRVGLAVAGSAPPVQAGMPQQTQTQIPQPAVAIPAPPTPNLPSSLSQRAAPGGPMSTSAPAAYDPLDDALPKHFS